MPEGNRFQSKQFNIVNSLKLFNGYVGGIGIILLVLSFFIQPGTYHGDINGFYNIIIINDSIDSIYDVYFDAETSPQWFWRTPKSFPYKEINLEISSCVANTLNDVKAKLYCQSMQCGYNHEHETFSRDLLIELLNANKKSISNEGFTKEFDELYNFIISICNRTVPEPMHHSYGFKETDCGTFRHFRGGNSNIYPVAIIMLLIDII